MSKLFIGMCILLILSLGLTTVLYLSEKDCHPCINQYYSNESNLTAFEVLDAIKDCQCSKHLDYRDVRGLLIQNECQIE
jgi:hypothetical protein